ncbi:MAG: ATP-dependent DNA helicase RecG [Oscillospiraceae bacterium]|nr:ATP-dependent DNA helicase RecG [Oscillospiraceae bacterium]
MATLDTPITNLPGIGDKKAAAFHKLGIYTYGDMISYFPRRYDDRSRMVPIAMAIPEDTCCVQAMVATQPTLSRIRRGMELVKFRIADDSGVMDVTYFNQPFMKNALTMGETYNFYGKVSAMGSRKSMSNPVYEKAAQPRITGRIIPVYHSTTQLSQKVIVAAAEQCLNACGHQVIDLLPEEVTRRNNLCQAEYAYRNIHFPESMLALDIARRRMVFEELFVLACAIRILHSGSSAPVEGLRLSSCDLNTFYATLPFTPTGAQKRAMEAALSDMTSGLSMNRLVQGDVGSGKTLVAAGCIWAAAQSGKVSAMMAPTEILAEQHLRTMRKFLEPCGLRVGLLTGSMTAKEKRTAKAALANHEYDLIVGTHAVLTGDVEIPDLALVIVDEQHRFGVEQRAALAQKGEKPHVLVMSATPIPRTLALIIYGDLDVSIIDELPPGRQTIDTLLVNESYRQRLNGFVRKQVETGRQVFVICPKVEEDEEKENDLNLKSAEEHAKYMQSEFPDLHVGCVHGRLKEKQKDAVMSAFVSGDIDILVATTVVEVGVDIPNANLMIIENADRFGLSQLHQLRGRIGRGEHKSWCVLVSDSTNEVSRERLKIMVKTSDGFAISEEDLRLRGPGDFFGNRQHGLPETHIADLGADMNVLVTAQEEANKLMETDPELEQHPKLKRHVLKLLEKAGDTFN